MTTNNNHVTLSQIDSDRFGIPIARASDISVENLPEIIAFCQSNRIAMLVARCPARRLDTVHALEGQNFLLMDTLVYYRHNRVNAVLANSKSSVVIREVQAGEEDAIAAIASAAFRGYLGHYHADPRLDKQKCDEAYIEWARRSATLEAADQMLVAQQGQQLVGFIALKRNSSDEGEGTLYAVDPTKQQQGIGQTLIISALQWFQSVGAKSMIISTQVSNVASQKVWVRQGFEPHSAYYTFHKWFI